MRRLSALVFVLVGALLAPGLARADDPERQVLGVWLTEGGEGRIEILRQADGRFAGRVVSGREDGDKDVHNPDPALRDRPVKGLEILQGFRHEGGGRFVEGRIYDPSSGNTYRAQLTLLDADTLKLRGYIGIPLLGGTQTWTREPAPAASPGPAD